jgi:hypothetical protein
MDSDPKGRRGAAFRCWTVAGNFNRMPRSFNNG